MAGRLPRAAMPSARTLRSRRPLVALALFAAVGVAAAVAQGDSGPDGDAVARELAPRVAVDVRRRLEDPKARIANLDCVAFDGRHGNCVADLVSHRRYNASVMVAVRYRIASDGSLRHRISLP